MTAIEGTLNGSPFQAVLEVDGQKATQVLKLIEKLEDLDDVQRVHANINFSEEMMAAYEESAAR